MERLKWCLLLLCIALITCTHPQRPPQDTITILDAAPGDSLTVTTAQSSVIVDTALSTVQVSSSGKVSTSDTTLFAAMTAYGPVVNMLPMEPRMYMLFFPTGKVTLEAYSRQTLAQLVTDVQSRVSVSVELIGHTDTVGTVFSNDILSMHRAEAVKALLVQSGLTSTFVSVTGQGSRSPQVQTPPQTDEPLNRRVEVIVR
jgi:outer membrane protein OmpA-like peptidoglycan-associated protein